MINLCCFFFFDSKRVVSPMGEEVQPGKGMKSTGDGAVPSFGQGRQVLHCEGSV